MGGPVLAFQLGLGGHPPHALGGPGWRLLCH